MKNYVIQKGDTFSSLARQFKLKNEGILKTYHNLHCPPEDSMQEPVAGKTILIPADPQFMTDDTEPQTIATSQDGIVEEVHPTEFESEDKKQSDKEEPEDNNEDSDSSSHEGKYFIVQKGTLQCNQGFQFPKCKVTSHQKQYWNDEEGNADYLAVTEDDLQLDPAAQPFGQCKLKPSSGGYLPCAYAPAGKWQKTYEKVKVMGKSCLTEISELMCSTGGKITILKHGQQSEVGKSHVEKANTQEQQVYNPVVDFDEFKEDTRGTDEIYYS
ncbi:DUF4280 and LysM peptidoglycan-binding domain-containing protein [Chryseobacterium culicis]|uniref:LysM domain-containing protein n=1 Tax=Chryseobacterium culicis TaxID=680127 RepID=A0A1H6HMI9_CHRCI|nr:PAAR-like protein [Chryseobacterium culicis]SEH36961.1 protein of unknown function [Chryseobacterium culicis]